MHRRSLTFLCAVAALSLVIPAGAWAKPNFSGTWKLNSAKSDFGQMTGPEKMERTVTHEDPSLKYSTVQTGPQGEVTSQMAYTTDGKPATNQTPMGEVTGAATWDGDVLNIENKREFQGIQITQTERWSLSEDGKTLTIDSRVAMPRGHVEMKMVFEKQ